MFLDHQRFEDFCATSADIHLSHGHHHHHHHHPHHNNNNTNHSNNAQGQREPFLPRRSNSIEGGNGTPDPPGVPAPQLIRPPPPPQSSGSRQAGAMDYCTLRRPPPHQQQQQGRRGVQFADQQQQLLQQQPRSRQTGLAVSSNRFLKVNQLGFMFHVFFFLTAFQWWSSDGSEQAPRSPACIPTNSSRDHRLWHTSGYPSRPPRVHVCYTETWSAGCRGRHLPRVCATATTNV